MSLLITGLAIFFLIHLIPSIPSFRANLINKLGENPYKGVFALASLAGFVLIVMGKGGAAFVPIWNPSPMYAVFTKLMMLPAMVFLIAAYAPCNLKRHTRHPMLWGVVLWAGGHLLINGDLASILLFGSFLAYALFDMASANARGATLQTEQKPLMNDIMVIVGGGVVYALTGLFHQNLFGVAIV